MDNTVGASSPTKANATAHKQRKAMEWKEQFEKDRCKHLRASMAEAQSITDGESSRLIRLSALRPTSHSEGAAACEIWVGCAAHRPSN